MSLNTTTSSERLHIGFFGCRNSGKSSLVNALTNQQLSVVSDIKGTTTDPVKKAMELLPIGPVVIIDTAGFDDDGKLGKMRVDKTLEILGKTDIAVLVIDSASGMNDYDKELIKLFEACRQRAVNSTCCACFRLHFCNFYFFAPNVFLVL